MTAQMTAQPRNVSMKGERHAAIRTVARFAAIAAKKRSGKPAPIQKQDRLFPLVIVLVFFIDNNQPEFFERRENRAAGADHNSGTTGMNLVPFIMALALG